MGMVGVLGWHLLSRSYPLHFHVAPCEVDFRRFGTVAKPSLMEFSLPKPTPKKKEIARTNPMMSQVLLRLVALPEKGTPRNGAFDHSLNKIRIEVAGVVGLDLGGGFELADDVEIAL